MDNPRFPHTLKIVIFKEDEHSNPVTDDDGNPVESYGEILKVVTKDGEPVKNADGAFVTESVRSLPFGYRTSTGNSKTSGDVTVCDYKLASPAFISPMPTGAILELTDYTRTFRVSVVKQATYNFGSNIWVDDIKN